MATGSSVDFKEQGDRPSANSDAQGSISSSCSASSVFDNNYYPWEVAILQEELKKYITLMPPDLRIGFWDVAILYSEENQDDAIKFRDNLLNNISFDQPVKIFLYNQVEFESISSYVIQHLTEVVERSTYIFIYLTENFTNSKWLKFATELCLMETISNPDKQWSLIPVFTESRGKTFKVPLQLNVLKGLNYYKNDKYFKSSVQSLINTRLPIRVKAEGELNQKRQKWIEDYKKTEVQEESANPRNSNQPEVTSILRAEDTEQTTDQNTSRSHRIKTYDDKYECSVQSIAILSEDVYLITNSRNDTLKLISRGSVRTRHEFPTQPWGMCVVDKKSETTIALSLPYEKCIQLMTVLEEKIVLHAKLSVREKCYDIFYEGGEIFVNYRDIQQIEVFSLNGDRLGSLRLLNIDIAGNGRFKGFDGYTGTPYAVYICYVRSIQKFSHQGELLKVYESETLKLPSGMTTTGDGHLLVCCAGSRSIAVLTEDLQPLGTISLPECIPLPHTIAYSEQCDMIYLHSIDSDEIWTFPFNKDSHRKIRQFSQRQIYSRT